MSHARIAKPPLSAAEWHALKVAARAADKMREKLSCGEYDVALAVNLAGKLKVLPDSRGSRNITPGVEELLGALLEKISARQRDKILDEIHADYVANDHAMPSVSQATADRVQKMLERLRRTEEVVRAGAVSGLFTVELLELK